MTEPGSRAQRRRRTEHAILQAAQQLFARLGYERTTIRSVAALAGVDPALVMQHFGNKESLFTAAGRVGAEQLSGADRDGLPEAALAELFATFEPAGGPEAAVALLRNCLTHPTAAQLLRDEVLCRRREIVVSLLEGPDAALRAQLFEACLLGLAISRSMLTMEPLASASQADVQRLLGPALRALTEPPLPTG